MSLLEHKIRHVKATVEEVLPTSGLAYLTDDHAGHWTVTRNRAGVGVANLTPGQRLDREIEHHHDFSLVSAYTPLD